MEKICILVLFIFFFIFIVWFIFFLKMRRLQKPSIQTYLKVNNEMKGPFPLCNKNTKKCKFPPCEKPCCNTNLLEMLENVSKVFENQGKEIFLCYGALLGLKRHKGFIPWDDDLDTMTTATSEDLEKMRPEIEKHGYVLIHMKGKGKTPSIPDYDYYTVNYSDFNKNHLDIALLTDLQGPKGSNFYVDAASSSHDKIKNNLDSFKAWLVPKDIFPLQEDLFYHVKVKVPKNPENLLKFWYGDDCLTKAIIKRENTAGILNADVKEEIKTFYPGPVLKRENKNKAPNEKYKINNCFIINLPWQHDRLHAAIEECERYNLPCERIEPVVGKDLDISKVPLDLKMSMKNNEIACYLSHVKAIQKVANSPEGNYIIFEDDFKILKDFDHVMTEIVNNPIPYDIIFLGASPYNTNEIESVTPYLAKTSLTTGCWSYMINPEAARKILKKIFPISYPIDLVLTFPDKKYVTNSKVNIPAKTLLQKILSFFKDRSKLYDTRFNDLKKYCVFTGKIYQTSELKNNRIGIVGETSTENKDSTSSAEFFRKI